MLPARAAAEVMSSDEDGRPPSGGSERILLVEDDATVLALTLDMLTGLGYRVMTATNAAAALKRLKGRKRFDLLFSDVVMPGGMNGVELARQARGVYPDLKVLLTSGYVGDEALSWANAFPMIDKPYARQALLDQIRALLDLDAPAAPAARARLSGSASITIAQLVICERCLLQRIRREPAHECPVHPQAFHRGHGRILPGPGLVRTQARREDGGGGAGGAAAKTELQDRLDDLCRLDALGLRPAVGHREEVGRQVRRADRAGADQRLRRVPEPVLGRQAGRRHRHQHGRPDRAGRRRQGHHRPDDRRLFQRQ
jgi:CheY-like chemotaxis protein